MRHEDDAQLDRIQRGDALVDGRRFRPPHDACADVDQIRRAVDDDRRCGSGAVGVGGRIPGAEQHDLRAAGPAFIVSVACAVAAALAFIVTMEASGIAAMANQPSSAAVSG